MLIELKATFQREKIHLKLKVIAQYPLLQLLASSNSLMFHQLSKCLFLFRLHSEIKTRPRDWSWILMGLICLKNHFLHIAIAMHRVEFSDFVCSDFFSSLARDGFSHFLFPWLLSGVEVNEAFGCLKLWNCAIRKEENNFSVIFILSHQHCDGKLKVNYFLISSPLNYPAKPRELRNNFSLKGFQLKVQ